MSFRNFSKSLNHIENACKLLIDRPMLQRSKRLENMSAYLKWN